MVGILDSGPVSAPNPITEASRPDGYVVSSDPARLDLAAVHAYLTRSYWSEGISADVVARAAAGSLCFGLYAPDGAQVGYARFITDRTTYAYLCDVYVLEAHRGRGLARWMIEQALERPDLAGLRRLVLVTRDAHELYRKLGFRALARPEGYMELHRPHVYRRDPA